jgi:hypothetical protein
MLNPRIVIKFNIDTITPPTTPIDDSKFHLPRYKTQDIYTRASELKQPKAAVDES